MNREKQEQVKTILMEFHEWYTEQPGAEQEDLEDMIHWYITKDEPQYDDETCEQEYFSYNGPGICRSGWQGD